MAIYSVVHDILLAHNIVKVRLLRGNEPIQWSIRYWRWDDTRDYRVFNLELIRNYGVTNEWKPRHSPIQIQRNPSSLNSAWITIKPSITAASITRTKLFAKTTANGHDPSILPLSTPSAANQRKMLKWQVVYLLTAWPSGRPSYPTCNNQQYSKKEPPKEERTRIWRFQVRENIAIDME